MDTPASESRVQTPGAEPSRRNEDVWRHPFGRRSGRGSGVSGLPGGLGFCRGGVCGQELLGCLGFTMVEVTSELLFVLPLLHQRHELPEQVADPHLPARPTPPRPRWGEGGPRVRRAGSRGRPAGTSEGPVESSRRDPWPSEKPGGGRVVCPSRGIHRLVHLLTFHGRVVGVLVDLR